MTPETYAPERTALLFVDPYNDFLSEGGKVWPRIRDVAEKVGLLDNLREVVAAVRAAGIRVFIVPHANTCIECTSRFAAELGYHVTLVKDATAATSDAAMRAAHEINGPTFAHAIVTTQELVEALSAR